MAHHLRAEVEAWHRLESDCYLLLGPFALFKVSRLVRPWKNYDPVTYSTKLIPFHWRLLFLIPTAEATLVNELRELLFHQLFNLGDGFIQALLCRAGNMKIQRGILQMMR